MRELEKYAKVTYISIFVLIVFWLLMSIVIQGILYPPTKSVSSTYDALIYYSHLKGYYGFDHVTKGISYLLGLIIPIYIFIKFKPKIGYINSNTFIMLLFGLLYFLINGMSLIVQGITAEYTINSVKNDNIHHSHDFVVNLFNWVIKDGGISFSTYITCSICLLIWIYATSSFLKNSRNKVLSMIVNVIKVVIISLVIIATIASIYQNISLANTFFSIIDILALIWIFILLFNKSEAVENS